MVTRRLVSGYPSDAAPVSTMGSFGTASSSFGTGSFAPAKSAPLQVSAAGAADGYGQRRSVQGRMPTMPAAATTASASASSAYPVPAAATTASASASSAYRGSAAQVGAASNRQPAARQSQATTSSSTAPLGASLSGGMQSRPAASSRENLTSPGRAKPPSLSFGSKAPALSAGELHGSKSSAGTRQTTGSGVSGAYDSRTTPSRLGKMSYPGQPAAAPNVPSGASSGKKRLLHDGPGAPFVSDGDRVEALVRGKWVRATVLSIYADDLRAGLQQGKRWMVHCDHEADGVCSFAEHVKLLSSASFTGKAEFEVGARVQALYESQWFLGVIVNRPEQDKEQLGRYTVQCDGDQEGCYTYAVHVRAAPAGSPPAPVPAPRPAPPKPTASAQVQADFVEGDRVECFCEGRWHKGTVIRLPRDDTTKKGRWTVQCDVDAQGTHTYASQVRKIGDISVHGREKLKATTMSAVPPPVPATSSSQAFPRQDKSFKEGDRVEGFYEGEWFEGVIVKIPQDDKDGFGRWTLQCDADAEGLLAYCKQVRAVGDTRVQGVPSSNDRTGNPKASSSLAAAKPGDATRTATGTQAAPVKLSSSLKAPISSPTVNGRNSSVPTDAEEDVPEVVVSQGMSKNGEKFIVVTDQQGKKIETFSQTHIAFEVSADTKSLNHWISTLKTEVLPGLLMCLAQEVNARGEKLKQLEKDREDLRGMEDYSFFGLSEEATDKDVEKAYKKMSSKLHPDKGGDASQFADMKKRFEQLKDLRADGSKKSKGDGEIKWDSKSRKSMTSAHDDLHLQLVWISKQCEALEKELEELRAKQRIHFSLTNGEQINQHSSGLPVCQGAQWQQVETTSVQGGIPLHMMAPQSSCGTDPGFGREDTYMTDHHDPLLGSEETLDPEEIPTIKLEADDVQNAFNQEVVYLSGEAGPPGGPQAGLAPEAAPVQAGFGSPRPPEAGIDLQGVTGSPSKIGARVLGTGLVSTASAHMPSSGIAPSIPNAGLTTKATASSMASSLAPGPGRQEYRQGNNAMLGAQPLTASPPSTSMVNRQAPAPQAMSQAAASVAASLTSYGHRVISGSNGVVSGQQRPTSEVLSPRQAANLRFSGNFR